MKKTLIAIVLACSMPSLVLAASGGDFPSAETRITSQHALQNGARLFVNFCLSCHSASFMRYKRMGDDLGLTEDEVKANLMFAAEKVGDTMTVAMRPADGEAWFGKAPPDLSVIARARGVDWLSAYLKSFYVDPERPVGWNNSVFRNASMPNALASLQGIQTATIETVQDDEGVSHELIHLQLDKPGSRTAEEFDDDVRDLVTFMEYMGEPAKLQRLSMGPYVLLFMVFFSLLTYLLKLEYWKDVH